MLPFPLWPTYLSRAFSYSSSANLYIGQLKILFLRHSSHFLQPRPFFMLFSLLARLALEISDFKAHWVTTPTLQPLGFLLTGVPLLRHVSTAASNPWHSIVTLQLSPPQPTQHTGRQATWGAWRPHCRYS